MFKEYTQERSEYHYCIIVQLLYWKRLLIYYTDLTQIQKWQMGKPSLTPTF